MIWKERIRKALLSGVFQLNDIEDASKWDTCAVGELKDIQRNVFFGSPVDNVLFNLGQAFDAAVYNQNFSRVSEIYIAIHKQVRKLKLHDHC